DGGEPLFVLDYISCGRNLPSRTADIVEGVARACAFAGCALLGGEISEHPGVMSDDEYDLVAFAVGVVARAKMLGPARVQQGDVVIGLASSGLHSNGYSLVRKLILDHDLSLQSEVPRAGRTLGDELLEPCRIHAPAVRAMIDAADVHAAAHITGGGIASNLERVLPGGLGARLDVAAWKRQPIFEYLQQIGSIPEDEMRRVFNCGLGMVIVVSRGSAHAAVEAARASGESASIVGEITTGQGVTIG
ncbi:MAG: phosphoribosylformylglycinamidine cyclo-ligase, partial [Actinomycetota bacterium]